MSDQIGTNTTKENSFIFQKVRHAKIRYRLADTNHFGVNVGFVRHYNAVFASEPAGPATEPDRRPAGISLAELAEVNVFNVSVCLQWREQALGLRAFYRQLQHIHQ